MLGVIDYDGTGPADELLEEYARGHRRRRDLQQHPGRRLLRRAGRRRCADPFFGGEGPRAHRLHALRQLHGRLPPRRQEHAGQELPLVRGEARRRVDARAHRSPTIRPLGAADGSRRLRGRQRALRRLVPQAPPDDAPRAASSSPPARSAPTSCSPTASTAAPCRGSPTASATLVRTNSESILAVTAPRRRRATSAASVAITSSIYPDRTPTSRSSPTARPATR